MANVAAEIQAKQNLVKDGLAAGNVEQVVGQFAEDCVVIGGGSAVYKGREGVKSYLAATKGAGVASVKKMEDSSEIGPLGDGFAFHNGQWEAFNKEGNKVFTIKSLAIWKKVGNDWQIHRESADHF